MTRPAVTPRAVNPRADITEHQWTEVVHDLAKVFGWEWYHPYLSIRSTPGWPDVALVRPPRFVLVELKREKGWLSTNQEHWLGILRQCPGIEVYLWRPSDWDEAQEVLR